MKYIAFTLLLFSYKAQSQKAEDIIKNCAANIKSLKSVSYSIFSESMSEKITADVTLKRDQPSPVFEVALFKAQGIILNEEGSYQLSFAYNGSTFHFLDLKSKEEIKLDSPGYNKLGRTGLMPYFLVMPPPYWQEQPFGVVLKQMTKAELLKDTLIYTENCYQVKTTMETNSQIAGKQISETVWFIGKKDLLLYGLSAKTQKHFIKIKWVNKELDQNYFTLSKSSVKTITGLEPLGEGLLGVGTTAPSWTLPSPNGNISLESMRGKIVLLDFWGTWCVPCIKAMPHIQAINDHFKNDKVAVLGISVEMEKADPVAFLKSKGYTYPTVLNGHTITKDYKVQIFPTVYLIDQNGVIIHAEYGGSRENFETDIIERIEKALKKEK